MEEGVVNSPFVAEVQEFILFLLNKHGVECWDTVLSAEKPGENKAEKTLPFLELKFQS
jgi:hypothetical protein